MVSPDAHHEREPLILARALDLAWDEVAFALVRDDFDAATLRTFMKERALDAVAKVY